MQKGEDDQPFQHVASIHNGFVTQPLEPTRFAENERVPRDLSFTRFRHNFALIWGSLPAGFGWFAEAQWHVERSVVLQLPR